ncbi:MAG TPA: beta-propeller domain-containing protein, partial [Mycobacteriales bacterium]|nr:beta-propeller domain-containing protein [Mycobacteriales bacterium]
AGPAYGAQKQLRAAGDAPVAAPAASAPAGAATGGVATTTTSGASGASSDGKALPFSNPTERTKGVVEPDIVQTDGLHVVTLEGTTLRVLDAQDPKLLGSVDLPLTANGANIRVLLDDKTVVVIGGTSLQPVDPRATHSTTTIDEVDITDPTDPTVARTLQVDGDVVDARLLGGITRLVLHAGLPRLAFVEPSGGSQAAQNAATKANQEILRHSTIADWLPTYTLADGSDNPLAQGNLVDCAHVARPQKLDDVDLLTVLSLDPTSMKGPEGALAVEGAGSTAYATGEHVYIASGEGGGGFPITCGGYGGAVFCPDYARPVPCCQRVTGADATTQVHLLDVEDPANTSYIGSVSMPGTLHGDDALDEHDGVLRVATTQDGGTTITTFHIGAGGLTKLGTSGAITPGEQVTAVRWIGDRAYVVTTRQYDPLTVVDLADPAKPKVRGHLDSPGYATYLVPSDADRLIGIGYDGQHRVTASLYDVSDADHPKVLERTRLGGYYTPADTDPHALLWWAPYHVLLVVVQGDEGVSKVATVDARSDGLKLVYAFTHAHQPGAADAAIQRALVIGPHVWTFSPRGVLVSSLSAGVEEAWVANR